MQCPPQPGPGLNRWKPNGFVSAASSTWNQCMRVCACVCVFYIYTYKKIHRKIKKLQRTSHVSISIRYKKIRKKIKRTSHLSISIRDKTILSSFTRTEFTRKPKKIKSTSHISISIRDKTILSSFT